MNAERGGAARAPRPHGHPADAPRSRRCAPPRSRSSRSPARSPATIRLLIMDEPSAILDEEEIETLFEVVRRLTAEGVGVIYISHRLEEIRRIGDRVTVLADGPHDGDRHPGDDADRGAGLADDRRPAGRAALPGARRSAATSCCSTSAACASCPAVRERDAPGPRRRGRRPRRAGRRRPQRAARAHLRHRDPRRGRGLRRRQAAASPAARRAAIKAGLGLAPEDRKSQGLVLDWSLTKNASLSDLGRFSRGGLLEHRRRARRACASSCSELNTVPDDVDRVGPPAVRRQPAEGRARALAAAATAACCCSTSRRAASTSPPRPRSTGSSPILRSPASACSSSRRSSRSWSGICTRILVMRKGEIVAEVDGATATEQELLRHAVAPVDAPVLAEEVQ